ncbi:MAG: MaoC family dehydratase [Zoogloeaceae bacterium]|jgi:acyl dehydratase|nr:MaoC family dehydratase [Zoogloeaceae bacterium]
MPEDQMSEAKAIYLENVAVGDRYSSREYPLDTAQIKGFARNFDPQPFHLDEVAAGESFFGGLAASGWHTAAITMRLMVESVPFAGGLIGAGVELSWPRPTRPGDALRVVSEITAIAPSRSKPDRGIVTLQSDTFNQRGEPVQRLVSRLLLFRRPGFDSTTASVGHS